MRVTIDICDLNTSAEQLSGCRVEQEVEVWVRPPLFGEVGTFDLVDPDLSFDKRGWSVTLTIPARATYHTCHDRLSEAVFDEIAREAQLEGVSFCCGR